MGIRGIPKRYTGDYGPLAPVEGLGSAIVPPPPADPRGSLALAGALAQGPQGLVVWRRGAAYPAADLESNVRRADYAGRVSGDAGGMVRAPGHQGTREASSTSHPPNPALQLIVALPTVTAIWATKSQSKLGKI